jgi:hypothetical protein
LKKVGAENPALSSDSAWHVLWVGSAAALSKTEGGIRNEVGKRFSADFSTSGRDVYSRCRSCMRTVVLSTNVK